MAAIVEVKLELGHRAKVRDVPSEEGHTHDWIVFVKGSGGIKLEHFVEKVVFWLHESYDPRKRVIRRSPYKVEEYGFAGFNILIDVHFRNHEEPMVRFSYDLFLNTESMTPVNHTRSEKLTFTNPTEDFRKKLLKAGVLLISPPPSVSKHSSKDRLNRASSPPPKKDQSRSKDSSKHRDGSSHRSRDEKNRSSSAHSIRKDGRIPGKEIKKHEEEFKHPKPPDYGRTSKDSTESDKIEHERGRPEKRRSIIEDDGNKKKKRSDDHSSQQSRPKSLNVSSSSGSGPQNPPIKEKDKVRKIREKPNQMAGLFAPENIKQSKEKAKQEAKIKKEKKTTPDVTPSRRSVSPHPKQEDGGITHTLKISPGGDLTLKIKKERITSVEEKKKESSNQILKPAKKESGEKEKKCPKDFSESSKIKMKDPEPRKRTPIASSSSSNSSSLSSGSDMDISSNGDSSVEKSSHSKSKITINTSGKVEDIERKPKPRTQSKGSHKFTEKPEKKTLKLKSSREKERLPEKVKSERESLKDSSKTSIERYEKSRRDSSSHKERSSSSMKHKKSSRDERDTNISLDKSNPDNISQKPKKRSSKDKSTRQPSKERRVLTPVPSVSGSTTTTEQILIKKEPLSRTPSPSSFHVSASTKSRKSPKPSSTPSNEKDKICQKQISVHKKSSSTSSTKYAPKQDKMPKIVPKSASFVKTSSASDNAIEPPLKLASPAGKRNEYTREASLSSQSSFSSEEGPPDMSPNAVDKNRGNNGIVQIFDDVFMNTKRPLKERMNIYEGYQEHVTGERLPLAIKAIFPFSKKSIKVVRHLVTLSPHPNIVQIIRFHKTFPLPILYMAMELCGSQNLEEYLIENCKNNSPFDFEKTMSYAKGLVKGMEHIHRNQIVHGNLIPENILFSLDGEQIKISNFSKSHTLHQSKSNAKMTGPFSFGFLSRRINQEERPFEKDIKSLAKILYSLFTNEMQDTVPLSFGCRFFHFPKEMELVKKDQFIDLMAKMRGYFNSQLTIEEVSLHPFFTTAEEEGRLKVKPEHFMTWEERKIIFADIEAGLRSLIKTTSNSSTQTRTSMETAGTQTDEVVTTFGNLDEEGRLEVKPEHFMTWEERKIIFADIEAGLRSLIKTTSNSSTQTRTSMETAGTQTDEVVTTFGNLDEEGRLEVKPEHFMTWEERKIIFADIEAGLRSLIKTTSNSSTQTRTSMETAGTQTDEVVTTFGNLDGGLAISKTIHKVIGSEPERLNVGGCLADFSPHSFSESTPVNVTAELNTSKRSKRFILFTPSLHVDANGLLVKIRVRLPSWYVNNLQQKVEARILHLPKNADDWEDTGMTLPVTSLPFFDFDWQDFSAVAVGDDKDSSNLQVLSQRIAGSVYISDENEVSIVFHNNDKATPTSESMALAAVKERMALTRPPKHLKIHLNQFTAKLGDNIEAHIECDVPSDLTFKPKEPFLFEVDEDFVEELFVEHHGVVSGSLEHEQRIEMYCTVHKVSGNERKMIRCPSFFACRWTPRNLGEKQKQSEKVPGQAVPPGVNLNVSVHADQSKHTETENIDNRGHHVTANKYFGAKANVTLSETDTSATVLNKVPANQN